MRVSIRGLDYNCAMSKRNIFLIGLMAVGKSTVGRQLAQHHRGRHEVRVGAHGPGYNARRRARVKVGRSAHSGRQPGRQPACMHCMHKNRLNFSDLAGRSILRFFRAGSRQQIVDQGSGISQHRKKYSCTAVSNTSRPVFLERKTNRPICCPAGWLIPEKSAEFRESIC